MIDLNTVNKRWFDVKIGEYTLQLEPCSLKTLRKLSEVDEKTTFGEGFMVITTVNVFPVQLPDLGVTV